MNPTRRRRASLVLAILSVLIVTRLGRRNGNKQPLSLAAAPSPGPSSVEGRYDIRRGAAGYAPIIGTFGALAVPAIVVLFSAVHELPASLLTMAAGLLIVAMIGSITGAIGLAAIGAERDLTANLVPAAMYLAVAVSLSLVAMLGAFEVLAVNYFKDSSASTTLFAVITGIAGLMAVMFTALSVADSLHTGPSDPVEKAAWQSTQWIQTQKQAERRTLTAVGMGFIPALTGIGLRLAQVYVTPNSAEVTWLVGSALGITTLVVGIGASRTRHTWPQKGLRWQEAYATTLVIGLYTLALVIFLPAKAP